MLLNDALGLFALGVGEGVSLLVVTEFLSYGLGVIYTLFMGIR